MNRPREYMSIDFRKTKDPNHLLTYYEINPPPNFINNQKGKSYNHLVRENLFTFMKKSDIIIYLNEKYLELKKIIKQNFNRLSVEEKIYTIKNLELYKQIYETYKNKHISQTINKHISQTINNQISFPSRITSYESAASPKYKRKRKTKKKKKKKKK